MTKQCCMCRKVLDERGWVEPKPGELDGVVVTHGFCEPCFERYMELIQTKLAVQTSEPSRGLDA